MKLFTLIAPPFLEWPLAIAEQLRQDQPGSRMGALVTHPLNRVNGTRVIDRVEGHSSSPIDPLYRLDVLEPEWLETPVTRERVEEYDRLLGNHALRRILIADRDVGRGYTRWGMIPETPLQAKAKDGRAEAYVVGALDFAFEVCKRHRPDAFFCYAVAGAPALAMYYASQHFGIPFLRLSAARIGERHVVDDSHTGLLAPVARRFEEALDNLDSIKEYIEAAQRTLERFRKAPEAPAYQSIWKPVEKPVPPPVLRYVRKAPRWVARMVRDLNRPLDFRVASVAEVARDRVRTDFQRYRSMRSFGDNPSVGRFVYFPLHVDPEASTTVMSPMQTDQLSVVDALAKSLPLDMQVVVKEHIPMLGRRPTAFYNHLKRIPGVSLCPPGISQFWLIERAEFVATITGTVAWEAVLLGKPALVMGDSPFLVMGEGLVHCPDFNRLPDAVREVLSTPPATDETVVRYLGALLAESFDFPAKLFWGSHTAEDVKARPDITRHMLRGILNAVEVDRVIPRTGKVV